jgi:hypothetical protein
MGRRQTRDQSGIMFPAGTTFNDFPYCEHGEVAQSMVRLPSLLCDGRPRKIQSNKDREKR